MFNIAHRAVVLSLLCVCSSFSSSCFLVSLCCLEEICRDFISFMNSASCEESPALSPHYTFPSSSATCITLDACCRLGPRLSESDFSDTLFCEHSRGDVLCCSGDALRCSGD